MLFLCVCVNAEDDLLGIDLHDLPIESQICIQETSNFVDSSHTLQDALVQLGFSLDLPNLDNATDFKMSVIEYPEDAVESFMQTCKQEGGKFVSADAVTYDCSFREQALQLIVKNTADCLAPSDNCQDLPEDQFSFKTIRELGLEQLNPSLECEIENKSYEQRKPQIILQSHSQIQNTNVTLVIFMSFLTGFMAFGAVYFFFTSKDRRLHQLTQPSSEVSNRNVNMAGMEIL